MTIDYKIDENDFLTHQLFLVSKSDRIRKRRLKSKVIVPLIYFALGLFFFIVNNYLMATLFIIIGILWFLLYPLWERQHYIKHYLGHIKENYKNRLGKTATLELSNDFIVAKDDGSESKVLTSEVEEISEIPSTIFIRLKGGQSFILPKDKITDIENVSTRLKELATHLKIKYDIDDKWEWK